MSGASLAPCRNQRLLQHASDILRCQRNLPVRISPGNRHGIRYLQSHHRFEPLKPLSPSSLPKATPAKQYLRTRKWLRRLFWISATSGGVLALDYQFNASAIIRSLRTFSMGILVGLDYKINFRAHPPLAKSIEEVHYRNAERLFNLLRTNGGLYLKIGQAVAMQSAVLPPEFQKMFSRMFDDAPQNDWADACKVIREDFGKSPEEVFGVSFDGDPSKGVMERTARASASVAQVHWAKLGDGREVAIKIQKREIAQQVGWDLWSFKVVARFYTWWFDLPFYTLVPIITERLMLETDFENEATNSETMKALVEGESRLRNRVYIPKVFRELSSRRVMTAEWIEGIRLWDKQSITSSWEGGRGNGSPGCHGTPLDTPAGRKQFASRIETHDDRYHENSEHIKPERNQWKGPDGKGGLGLSMKDVMGTMVDLFSAQMFLWGVVHCDPHPGNIFVRRQPSGKAELVLIDHGLYIQMDNKFRHEYALLWKSLMTFDNKTIAEIVTSWGIGNADVFASATLMRPYEGGTNHSMADKLKRELQGLDEHEKAYRMQEIARKQMREFLQDDTKLPKELIWIGRNLRIVQGNNQFLGSPVNRIKITGQWASRALVESRDLSFSERLRNFGSHLIFKFVLLGSDFAFYFSRIRQMLGIGGGMEDDLENQMKGMMKEMGVELNHSVFDG